MSKDEARKLLGGYATGSLTDAERRVLFEAALQDQELFDELAGEQVLKEVLDEPGARQRLISALEPPRRHRAWLWATAAASVPIALVIGIVVSNRTPPPAPPQQIAQVSKPPEPVNTPTSPPVAEPAPVRQKVAPAPPPPAPPAEVSKDENAAGEDQLQQNKPQAAAGAIRQFSAVRVAGAFAFNYTVGADGFLEITPDDRGFLSVTAGDAVVFPSTAVDAGTAVRIAIPSNATSLEIAFSRTQGVTGTPVRRDAVSGNVRDQDPPNGRIAIQLFLTPATR